MLKMGAAVHAYRKTSSMQKVLAVETVSFQIESIEIIQNTGELTELM